MYRYCCSVLLAMLSLSLATPWCIAVAQTNCEFSKPAPDGVIPARTLFKNQAPSLVGDLVYEFLNPVQNGDRITAAVSLAFILNTADCNPILYPLGLTFRGATFPKENIQDIELAESVGIANLSFDSERLVATLAIVLPLPRGFHYSVALKHTPAAIDETTISVAVIAPGSFGKVLEGEWTPDRNQVDFGLRSLSKSLGIETALDQGREASLKVIENAYRDRFSSILEGQSFDLGAAHFSQFKIDWARWERGDQVLTALVSWPGTDASLSDALPSSAEVRIELDGRPQIRLANLEADKIKAYLADRIAGVVDTSALEDMIERFGGKTISDLPLGWLKLRNASISDTELKADVAFAIGDEVIRWVPMKVDLPANEKAFAGLVEAIGKNAAESLAAYAAKMAERTVYDQVSDFVSSHSDQAFSVFGISAKLALVPYGGSNLPPKPLVVLSSSSLGIEISNVGLLIDQGSPVFDWSSATISGLDALGAELLKQTKLGGGDLSLTVSGLRFTDGKIKGDLKGVLFRTPFIVPIELSEKDSKLSLPSLRQEMIVALQNMLSGRSIDFAGLTLANVQICPDGATGPLCGGDDIVATASVKIAELFEGAVTLKVHPTLEIKKLTVNPTGAFGGLAGIFQAGPVKVNPPTEFNPVVLTGEIEISKLFGAIPIPNVPFRYSTANGKLELTAPNEIVIPTDVPIPPWLSLAQVRIPLKKRADGQVEVTARVTLGQSYVQYIFNIDGTLTANPDAQKVSIAGKASLLTVPLYTVEGYVDFKTKEGVAKSSTPESIRDIIDLSNEIRITGTECLVSQDQHISFLFFEASGAFLIQVPPSLCGSPMPQRASSCGLKSAGGVCLKADASAGALGRATATFTAGFDLAFTVAMETKLDLILPVELKVAASKQQLRITARVPKIAKFGFVIKDPGRGADAIAKDIIDEIVEALTKPDLKLPLNFELSGGAKGSVDVSEDSDGSDADAGANQVTPNGDGSAPVKATKSGSKEPVQGGKPNVDPTPGSRPAPEVVSPPVVAPVASAEKPPEKLQDPKGDKVAKPPVGVLGRTGPVEISFDAERHVVATNTETGIVQKSSHVVAPHIVDLFQKKCFGWVEWVAGSGTSNISTGAVHAGAVVFGVREKCNDPVPYCEQGKLCAIDLVSGTVNAAVLGLGGISWSSAKNLSVSPAKATDLELSVLRGMARQQLYPNGTREPASSEWRCAVIKSEVCTLAVGWDKNGKPVLFVDNAGVMLGIEQNSLIEWAASASPDVASSMLTEAVDGTLSVVAEQDGAWLIVARKNGQAGEDKAKIVTRDKPEVPVGVVRIDSNSAEKPWKTGETRALMNYALKVMKTSADETGWMLDFLGNVGGGERLLLLSDTQTYLLTRTSEMSACRRKASREEITGRPELGLAKGDTLLAKLSDVMSLESTEWRQRGFRRNPVFALFGNDCN